MFVQNQNVSKNAIKNNIPSYQSKRQRGASSLLLQVWRRRFVLAKGPVLGLLSGLELVCFLLRERLVLFTILSVRRIVAMIAVLVLLLVLLLALLALLTAASLVSRPPGERGEAHDDKNKA